MEMVDSHIPMFITSSLGARNFYVQKIIDFKTEEKKEHDKEMRKMKAKILSCQEVI